MATIPSKTYKLETPTSSTDSNYAEFEYMLYWYGRDGSAYQYLFTDWEEQQRVMAGYLNVQNKAKLQNIIASEERPVKLVAEDLSLNDFKALQSILVSKIILRLYKDGTTERIGIESNSSSWRQTDGRYDLEFDVIQYEKALAK